MGSTSSLHEVLGIPINASCKKSYRKLARVYHSDMVSNNQKDMLANELMKIYATYFTLSGPNKRANYDRDLCKYQQTFGSSSLSCNNGGCF
ncbi:hypothetical protein MANES_11G082813v8 [Manihot esculenta]|uniref:Uncharacterized protein n=1 Tax=Manihot esculenta TaxID=3983 RepID=A0ACB7GVU5_MANES|nr:hypothetical protein MANES_11G082813v8 [Manihot esculenta]